VNIFFLDFDVTKCAEFHVNTHSVKMVVEYAQLLCNSHWVTGSQAPYKKTHVNHPSSIWVRQSRSNYLWLCKLGLALGKEYTYRYGKVHKSSLVIEWAMKNVPRLPRGKWTPPTPAMPEDCIIPGDSLESYRQYYRIYKTHIHSWKRREKPNWL
jgi:hypothetical protein